MIVVDTSVAYKWTDKNEGLREKAFAILKAHVHCKVKIIVPDLIFYELANAWATKTALKFPKIKSNLKDLEDSILQLAPLSFNGLEKAIKFSKKYHVSVYDASYAVLAQENNCDLFTADSKFVKAVNLPFVKHLSDYSFPSKVN